MYLTKEEERILNGDFGLWPAKAMKLLVAQGELNDAERMIKIERAHISGVSYKTAGLPMIELLEDMVRNGVRVKIFSTLNPAGMDLERWKELGVPEDFAKLQKRLIDAYVKLGVIPTLTCAPYLAENRPKFAEPVAFSESSAVVFVNSVLGARTNRNGNLDVLSAAIVGRIPKMGLLLKENRRGTTLIKVKAKPNGEYYYGLLGLYVGNILSPREIPVFELESKPGIWEMRALGAGLAAAGSTAMFHIVGITPEAKNREEAFQGDQPKERLAIQHSDLISFEQEHFPSDIEPDLIAIGCPHATIEEIKEIARKIGNRKVKNNVRFWIYTSRYVKQKLRDIGILNKLEMQGIKIISDTCMVVSPIEALGIKKVYTNSGKAAWYIPKLTKNLVVAKIKSLDQIINKVTA